MSNNASVSCDVDLEGDGKRIGALQLVYSDNRHAFGVVPVPIAVIANGEGPTVIISGGCHGDEYEGQVIARRLIHELEPGEIKGRLIILPALNYPAVLDDARVSPLDGGNLNRSFPGEDSGPPTTAIAGFIDTRLLPLCNAGIDLHSGGKLANYLPSAFLCISADKAVFEASLALTEAFAAPFTYVVRGDASPTGFDPAAHRRGVAFMSTELLGGGGVDPEALRVGRDGVTRVLAHLGVIGQDQTDTPTPTRFLSGVDAGYSVMSPVTGIFEPRCEIGEAVVAGQAAGRVYALEEVDRPPVELSFDGPGIVTVRRAPARVRRGDYVFSVAPEISRETLLDIL